MNDEHKTREELLQELRLLRQGRDRCEASIIERERIQAQLLERVKELNCLYGVTQLAQRADTPLDELCTEIAELVCASWQFPESTCACITIDGRDYASSGFRRSQWCQRADIVVQGETAGGIEVCYLEEFPAADEGPFLKEERSLLSAVADLMGRIVTQRRVEEQMRSLSRELIMIQENERQRIARELHDHLAQDLSLARLGIERIFSAQAPASPLRLQTDDVLNRISGAIEAIRNLAYGLLPPGLSELRLADIVLRHCEEFSQQQGIQVDVYADGLAGITLDFETKINIYRLIQESLTNVRKHAGASRVEIRLLASYPELIVRIQDDGRGADMEKCLAKAGRERRMGLWSMRERVRVLGGTIDFHSRPSKGMRIRVVVPIARNEHESQKTNPDH